MRLSTPHDRLRHLERHLRNDDGAALLLTLFTIVTIAGLSLVLLASLVSQYVPLYTAEKRTQAVYAAETGLQAGLAELRSHQRVAADGNTYGDPAALPCAAHSDPDGVTRYYGELLGSVDSGLPTDSGLGYRITISYHSDDPVGKGETWIKNPANQIHCGLSTHNQPPYAVVTATGTGAGIANLDASVGNRTISAIYQFRVTNVNIPGGLIWLADGSRCLMAENTATNSRIGFGTQTQCENPANASRVNWVYNTKWHLVLASTIGVAGVDELCITNPNTTSTSNQTARFRECGPGGANREDAGQRWSWNASWTWNGAHCSRNSNSDPVDPTSSNCQRIRNNTQIKPYRTGSDWLGFQHTSGTPIQFDPTPAVGAGAASYSTQQLVNYKEFGRCADVTYTQINYAHMIVYPCKQDATGANVFDWNHKWMYTEPPRNYATGVLPELCTNSEDSQCKSGPQSIRVNNGSNYCLTVVSTTGISELQFKPCTGGATQQFTRYTHTADQAKSWSIQDNYGRCLTADGDTKFEGNWSHLRMMPCVSGGLDQKWNAPPQSSSASFGSFREVSE